MRASSMSDSTPASEDGFQSDAGIFLVGCDIGGTFTDLVLLNRSTGEITIGKCLSTRPDPSDGLMAGLRQLQAKAGEYFSLLAQIAHATTLVANTVIERKGARCALLCTEGFRDVLEVRRHVRVTTYELWSDPPEPLVPRHLRLPVSERTLANGTIARAIDPDEIHRIAAILRQEKVESITVAFLHSYRNPTNELQVQQLLAKILPGVPITTSAAVLPQIKEYERTCTAVVNAYVRPLVQSYLTGLDARLRSTGITAPVHVMLSNGGTASLRTAVEFPIRLIESGPVAGAKAAQHYREVCRLGDVLAFDMGGTTAKACLIQEGEVPITEELEVARTQRFTRSSGYPIAVPGAHLIEIGAGGGSIAAVNSLGLVQVGPESASSEPGPACYARGGRRPTVTDADLILGYLNSTYFAGGALTLDLALAHSAIVSGVAEPAQTDVLAGAWSIHDVVNETMAAAIRIHMAERGGRLNDVTLIAFGGAGPVHAYNLASKLGISRLLVPQRAGVLSAVGLVISAPAYDIVRSVRAPLSAFDPIAAEAEFRSMEADIDRRLRQVDPDGAVSFVRSADIGYIGQGYQVTVPANELTADALWHGFSETYRAKYGYFYDDVPAEVVNLRANGRMRGVNHLATITPSCAQNNDSLRGRSSRLAYSRASAKMLPFTVYDRTHLVPEASIEGPAIIEEPSSTTIVDAGGSLMVDQHGTLVITVSSRSANAFQEPER